MLTTHMHQQKRTKLYKTRQNNTRQYGTFLGRSTTVWRTHEQHSTGHRRRTAKATPLPSFREECSKGRCAVQFWFCVPWLQATNIYLLGYRAAWVNRAAVLPHSTFRPDCAAQPCSQSHYSYCRGHPFHPVPAKNIEQPSSHFRAVFCAYVLKFCLSW